MAISGGHARRNPFARDSPPVSPSATLGSRPKSIAFPTSSLSISSTAHNHRQLVSQSQSTEQPNFGGLVARDRSHSHSKSTGGTSSSTFAPRFIQTEEAQKDTERVRGIEGENDFSGKRYVWLQDQQHAFVKGWGVEERPGDRLLVQCDDGSVSGS